MSGIPAPGWGLKSTPSPQPAEMLANVKQPPAGNPGTACQGKVSKDKVDGFLKPKNSCE